MDIISLNVGGKKFMTTLQTLTQYSDSFLGVMFSNRYQLSYDKKGRVFIDRDGELFHHILTFLRSGSDNVGFTTKDNHFHLIINEFQYFGLLHHLILSSTRPFYQSIAPPSKFSFSRVALLSGHIYIFGLRNSAPLVEVYNPLVNQWDSNRTDMFPIRGPYISMNLGIYASGNCLSEIKYYDPKFNKWNCLPMNLTNCQDIEMIDFYWCTYKENEKMYQHQHQQLQLQPTTPTAPAPAPASIVYNRQISYLLNNERQTLSIYCVNVKQQSVTLIDASSFAQMTLESACLIGNKLYYTAYNELNEFGLYGFDTEKRVTSDRINQNPNNRSQSNTKCYKMLGHTEEFIYFLNQCQSFFGIQRESKFFAYSTVDNNWVSLPEPKNIKILHCVVLSNCIYAIGEDYFIEMFDISRNQWY